LRKKWEYNEASALAISKLQETLWSVRREVLYNILIESGVSTKANKKIYLNESYSRFWVGKHLCDTFPTENGLKQDDVSSPLILNVDL
jgi:hypothetical protein